MVLQGRVTREGEQNYSSALPYSGRSGALFQVLNGATTYHQHPKHTYKKVFDCLAMRLGIQLWGAAIDDLLIRKFSERTL